jgi:hypothetical protein
MSRLADRHGGILGEEEIVHARLRVPGMARPRHVAQIGRESREEAEALCAELRADGAVCMVLRN